MGLEKGLWCLGTVSAIALSLFIITKVLKTLPIGTAYAVWTGIGAVGTVLMGIIFFKEPVSFGRLFFYIYINSFYYRFKSSICLKNKILIVHFITK